MSQLPRLLNSAVFLDRDGVLLKDTGLLVRTEEIKVYTDTPPALALLKESGFLLIVVTNQTVVSRGLASVAEVTELNREISNRIVQTEGPRLVAFYVCPHHPNATLPEYRIDCQCRKPRPGMLLQAAKDYDIDLTKSFMIGDRITDIIAGAAAGCKTILVESGAHLAPPIETADPLALSIKPDYTCADLLAAAGWILENQ